MSKTPLPIPVGTRLDSGRLDERDDLLFAVNVEREIELFGMGSNRVLRYGELFRDGRDVVSVGEKKHDFVLAFRQVETPCKRGALFFHAVCGTRSCLVGRDFAEPERFSSLRSRPCLRFAAQGLLCVC